MYISPEWFELRWYRRGLHGWKYPEVGQMSKIIGGYHYSIKTPKGACNLRILPVVDDSWLWLLRNSRPYSPISAAPRNNIEVGRNSFCHLGAISDQEQIGSQGKNHENCNRED